MSKIIHDTTTGTSDTADRHPEKYRIDAGDQKNHFLRVSALCKVYGGVQAVHNVSFTVHAGEMLALIGPNGAGKSTTFGMMSGQVRPDSGSVWLGERDITGLLPRKIWQLGVGRTFQVPETFGSLTVLENIQVALFSRANRVWNWWQRSNAIAHDQAMALLARVGMAEQAGRLCGELAYGDMKRVELALALTNDPALLLMDEPTAGMSPDERHALMALTRTLASENGLAVLFTEHSMDVVFGYADRIAVMANGELITQGSVEAVRNDSQVQQVYFGNPLKGNIRDRSA